MKLPSVKVQISSKKLNVVLAIIAMIAIVGSVAFYDGFQKLNFEKGVQQAEEIASSMILRRRFDWSGTEHSWLAVIYCTDQKFFVEKPTTKFSEEVVGCEYESAKDIEIKFSADTWHGKGFISFSPIPTPTPETNE